MAIPKAELKSHKEWIKGLQRVPKKECLVNPNDNCIQPDIRKNFLAVSIPIFEGKVSNDTFFHATRPRICPGCSVSAKLIRNIYNTTPR